MVSDALYAAVEKEILPLGQDEVLAPDRVKRIAREMQRAPVQHIRSPDRDGSLWAVFEKRRAALLRLAAGTFGRGDRI